MVNASLSDNTRHAYAGAWLDGCGLDNTALAAYLHGRAAAGRGIES